MAITQSSSFIGTPVNELFENLVLGAETIEKGLLHIFPDKRNKVYLNRFVADANPLVPRVPTPTTAGPCWIQSPELLKALIIM